MAKREGFAPDNHAALTEAQGQLAQKVEELCALSARFSYRRGSLSSPTRGYPRSGARFSLEAGPLAHGEGCD